MGLLYRAELGTPLRIGQRCEGFVKTIRPDGKIDLSLDPAGYARVKPLAERILATLRANNGHLAMSDTSPPEAIRDTFQASKKAFKQALGTLYRNRLIDLTPSGIQLKTPR
jgi:predicted RNA-binding protein (virulence factor B family)